MTERQPTDSSRGLRLTQREAEILLAFLRMSDMPSDPDARRALKAIHEKLEEWLR